MYRLLLLCILPSLIVASPFCMCPNGQPGQAISCPPPKEPSCPQTPPCQKEDRTFRSTLQLPELPQFPTLPPIDTKNMFRSFSLPTLPPSMNFFPNLFDSTTTESPDTPAPTAPPPPPPPPEMSTLPTLENPTLAPFNQRAPFGVPPSGQQIPYGQQPMLMMPMGQQQMMSNGQPQMMSNSGQPQMMSNGQMMSGMQPIMMGQQMVQPQQPLQQQYFTEVQQGARQFPTVISGSTMSPVMITDMRESTVNQLRYGPEQGAILTGTVAQSEDNDMELVQPITYKKTVSIYENEKNNGYRKPVKRAASQDEVSSIEKCNDERLKKIILGNVDGNPSTSKRAIQKAASEQIGGLFDVICSTHDFSYLANTQLFCEAGNDEVTCFAFLHTLLQ